MLLLLAAGNTVFELLKMLLLVARRNALRHLALELKWILLLLDNLLYVYRSISTNVLKYVLLLNVFKFSLVRQKLLFLLHLMIRLYLGWVNSTCHATGIDAAFR